MTEDKSKRKSTRKFNLEKHVKRSFNLEKEVAATPAPPSAEAPATPHTPAPAGGGDATRTGNGGNKGKHVLSLVVGLAVVAAIGFAAFRGCSGNSSQPVDEPVVDTVMDEQPTDSTQRADSTQLGGGDQNAPADAPNEVQPQDETVNAATPSAQPETSTPSTPSATKAATPSKDMDAEVQKVLRGDYGNGQERKDKLGSSYTKIQHAVNRYYRSKGLL